MKILILSMLSSLVFAAPIKSKNQQIDDQVEYEIAQALRLPRIFAAEKLQPIKERASIRLEEFAFGEKWPLKTRWKAFMVLMKLKGQSGLGIAERAFNDSTWFMRSAALTAVQEIDLAKAKVWAYKSFSKDKALLVRMKALEVLKGSRNQKIRKLMWHKMFTKDNLKGNKSLWIRSDIARELVKNPKNSEITQWKKLLHGKDKELQVLATQALSQLRPKYAPGGADVSYWREKFPSSQKF